MYIVTVPNTARAFLRGQVEALKNAGFEVVLVATPTSLLWEFGEQNNIDVFGIPMARKISPWSDIKALWLLIKLIREQKPDIVNAGTPKAGLVGMLAACFAHVPVRIYQLRGLRFETTVGFRRSVLTLTERIAARCAHKIVCNSKSLCQTFLNHHLAPPQKLIVLGHGSSNGVDPERFLPSHSLLADAARLRNELGIPNNARVLGYVGRFTKDKGIVELIETYDQILQTYPNTHLLLVGDFENGDPVPPKVRERIISDPQIKYTGFVRDVAAYYHIMDVLLFPSYREGLPNVPLEAAVAGIPTIGFKTTGVVDAVKDGETGILVSLGDINALSHATLQLLSDSKLRRRLGLNAQKWVLANFKPEDVWQNWIEFYSQCLHNDVLAKG